MASDRDNAGLIVPISPADLLRIEELYDSGLCLQAYHASRRFGPLRNWIGPARTIAARLAANLGAPRLSWVLHWRAWRENRSSPDLAAYQAHSILSRRGPLAAWEFLERCPPPRPNQAAEDETHFYAVRGIVAGHLRDFSNAETFLHRAQAAAPDHPWVEVAWSTVCELSDRYDEALDHARRSLELRPWFRPGVQAVAHTLRLLDQDEEALAFLIDAASHIENMHVVRQLALLQGELHLYPDAAASLDRFEALAPLMEKEDREWVRRHRITLDCLQRRIAEALSGAKEIDEPYYRDLSGRLAAPGPYRRVLLPVPFVRQHHLTCAPATLSAISRYWKRAAEHLEIAERICYDGTPAHSERNWAEGNGWVTREFTVTWDAARALLDRGVPFTLTTSEITNSHLQAVVGYDELRQTLWIRDPFHYSTHEFVIKPLLERYQSTGPRGMALVPAAHCGLFDGIELPDASLYDELHRVQSALAEHQRAGAMAICEKMQASAPDHRLTLTARRALAGYDANTPALLECLERLLAQFPDDGHLQLSRLGCLAELTRREERLQLLEQLCLSPKTDPVFWQSYAQELRQDARERGKAIGWARWALRYRPLDPAAINAWADLLWDGREFERAAKYYRLAAGLGERSEQFSRSHFLASLHLRRSADAIQFLRERCARLGRKASAPTVTLVESLEHLGQTEAAFAALEEGLHARPTDSALHLFAAEFSGRYQRFESARRWMDAVRHQSSPAAWHRAAAAVASYANKKTEALEHWREVLRMEPLAHDAIRSSTLLLAETEGRPAALAFLSGLCERFPFSCPLLALRIQWLSEDGADAAIPELRRLVQVNPADAWGWRELAFQCINAGNLKEAESAAQEAIRLEPTRSYGYSTRASLRLREGRLAEARADLKEALKLEVDNEYALTQFVTTAPSLSERKEALAIVAAELRRQVIPGRALQAYQEAARGVLPPLEVLALLREAHQARPDLSQSWSVLVNQLVDIGDYDEASALAREATTRFPLLPRAWVDLARVEQARLRQDDEIASLRHAVEINPAFTAAARLLASAYEQHRRFSEARSVLEQAIAVNPLEALNHGCLAQVLWKMDDREGAVARIQQAIRLLPGYDWAWNTLREWGPLMQRPQLALEMARDLTVCRPGEARSWLLLAQCLTSFDPGTAPSGNPDEVFAALERAIQLNPACDEAWDWRARVLAFQNRFDDALAACSPPAIHPVPARLAFRAAWIEAQRGNLARAIERVKCALETHPDFYAGWQMLAEWLVQSQDLDGAIAAAEKMTQLAPLEPIPLGYLGDLKNRCGDHRGARAVFERAFTLHPDYQYAGFELFGLQLDHRDFQSAERTLAILERATITAHTRACAVQLAAARSDWDAALRHFNEVCRSQDLNAWALTISAKPIIASGRYKAVDKLLSQLLMEPQPHPAVAEFWVERQASRFKWGMHAQLKALQSRGPAGRRAVIAYLDHIADALRNAKERKDISAPFWLTRHFNRVVRQHRHWLRADSEGWGKVGYVLTVIGKPRPVVDWLGDWNSRPDAQSWMLYNLVLMLRRLGRHAEAREVIRHALSLRHQEDLYQIFHVWAAFEDALEGNCARATAYLNTFPSERLQTHLRPMEAMTRLLLMHHADPQNPSFAAATRTSLRAALGKGLAIENPDLRTALQRFTCVAGKNRPGLRLWVWWRANAFPLIFITVILLGVALSFFAR